jgi:uncharacterized LabA/DUF88 family protein
MDRIAIFVDSGYLFAQGSVAVAGSKQPRTLVQLDPAKVIDALRRVAEERAPDCRLLRIYWYDGAIGGSRPTSDQALLAGLDDVKLRLGFVNSHGQQKGVDSLIVTDLIELARLKSVTDALLLSGDEDVRVGVQIAQTYGVRVHLLGIHPSRGSQSQQLLQEADTTTEWSAGEVGAFIGIRPTETATPAVEGQSETNGTGSASTNSKPTILKNAVADFVGSLSTTDLEAISEYWKSSRGVPSDLDKRLLRACLEALGRHLDDNEKKQMRSEFKRGVEALNRGPFRISGN